MIYYYNATLKDFDMLLGLKKIFQIDKTYMGVKKDRNV